MNTPEPPEPPVTPEPHTPRSRARVQTANCSTHTSHPAPSQHTPQAHTLHIQKPQAQKPHFQKPQTQKPSAATALRHPLPELNYPPELPVSQRSIELCEAISKHPVVIVCGATGSGKTTQLPKMCLALGRGKHALIGHTQPRRLAAITVAQRIASELKTECGAVVGYQVRFAEQLQAGAWVKLMTDGILLAETQRDPDLRAYDTLIIDEAHERSLNIDFLLGYLKQLLARRPDLKIVITSATIDADRFAAHFASIHGPAPIIMVEGRTYPVDIRYAAPDSKNDKLDWTDHLCNAVDELDRDARSQSGSTDMLVFLPGEREIKDAEAALRKHYHMSHVKPDLLPLYSRLSAADQQKVFSINRSGTRRIVLATNVAETSVTVPGIRYVIDTGTARMKRYSYRNKVEQLLVEPISQAAANQRAGRCGRVAAGVCLRLYEEIDFNRRPAFTEPEILRSSLAAVILRMKSLRLMDIEHFPFIDAPSSKAIADGYAVLQELGAIESNQALTAIGKQLAQLPTDPRLGRMVLAGAQMGALHEVLVIVSALSVQDPRERPADKAGLADQAHKPFADEKSEFLSLLKLWAWFDDTRKELSVSKTFAACKAKFLNGVRMREWADVHAQLSDMAREMRLVNVAQSNLPKSNVAQSNVAKSNDTPADYKTLHTALLSGLLGNVGFRAAEDTLWSGCRGIKFLPHPGVHLSKKPAQWIVAGSLTETTRLYARTVAAIEPPMIEAVAGHLITRSYSDPSWSRKQAQTTAFERGTLYALPIYHGRRVSYATINPELARETMIRGALVAQDYDCSLPFFTHNAKLIKDIEKLEHQSRRPDLMVDEALLFAFYDSQIPADVVNGAAFEAWWKAQSKTNPRLLYLSKDDLLRREAAGITVDSYPKHLRFMGQEMKLDYRFEVGSPRDGATLSVPLVALNQVDAQACEWLVPGMLKDKIAHLLKSLPPRVRHRCQPVADNAAVFVDWAQETDKTGKVPLLDALLEFVRDLVNVPVKFDDFKPDMLPAHCLMNYQVIDEHGRMLDVSRSLATLKAQFGAQAQAQFVQAARGMRPSAMAVGSLSNQLSASLVGGLASTQAFKSAALHQRGGAGALPEQSVRHNVAEHTPNRLSASTPERTPDRMTTWLLSDWPELMEVQRKGQVLMGFPALRDAGDAVVLEVFDDEQVAKDTHRAGLRRLVSLQIKEPLKALEKTLKPLQATAAQASAVKLPIHSAEALVQTVINAALDSIIAGFEPPKTAPDFEAMVAQARAKTSLLAQEWARRVQAIVTEAAAAYKKIGTVKTHTASHAHLLAQYERLFHKQFLSEPFERLGHYPRYLQAMVLRGDKLRADPARDARLMAELAPLWAQHARAKTARKGQLDDALDTLRWLLEELHVGLFAQELKTPTPVSVKRVAKAFEGLER